jgi:uncharacterized iron-regulated membrane protein
MMPVYRIRTWHRWLGVGVGAQLLLWVISGLFFAWTDIDEIHGDHLRVFPEPVTVSTAWVSPTSVIADLGFESPGLVGVRAINLLERSTWVLTLLDDEEQHIVMADAETGVVRVSLTQNEALALAVSSFAPKVPVLDVILLDSTEIGAHHEYRGGEMPVWRISFDHGSGTRVYVSARSGRVVTHRNSPWRAFDFLWMLHTMDYAGRDDINTPQLRIVSSAALLMVLSGYWLFMRTRRKRQ